MISAVESKEIAALIARLAEEIIVPAANDIRNVEILDAGPDKATAVDEAMETAVLDALLSRFPGAHGFGEEGMKRTPHKIQEHLSGSGSLFIVDALDGTNYFVRQDGGYGTLVSLLQRDDPARPWQAIGAWTYDVPARRMIDLSTPFGAVPARSKPRVIVGYEDRLSRRLTQDQFNALSFDAVYPGPSACEAIQQCHRGEIDGFMHHTSTPWDHYAGIALLRGKAGFTVWDWQGRDVVYGAPVDKSIFARSEALARAVLNEFVPHLR